MDPAVEALRRLVGDNTAKNRQALALKIGANPESIYQILAGVPLGSGRPRSVGRELRAKLDEHFPGWLTTDSAGPQARPVPTIEEALPVVLAALSELSPVRWQMVRGALDNLASHPEMRDDVAEELLPLLQATSRKRRDAA